MAARKRQGRRSFDTGDTFPGTRYLPPVSLRERLTERLRDRRVTSTVRRLLDDYLPPVVREWRPLTRFLATQFHGQRFDLDFKQRAFAMSPQEISAAYAALDAGR